MPQTTADGRKEVTVEHPEDHPDNWVPYETAEGWEYYVPYSQPPNASDSRGTHILRGTCDAEVDGETCGNDAAVRRITPNGEVEEYCKIPGHGNEGWFEAIEQGGDGKQLDDTLVNLRLDCEKMVVNTNVDGRDQLKTDYHGEGDTRDRIRRDPSVHECGDRAFVLVSDGDRWSKAFCRQHARTSWYGDLFLPTGDPTEGEDYPGNRDGPGWPDGLDRDDCVWVDAPSGEGYESHIAWAEAMNGRYSDVMEAEQHLVVLTEDGSPAVFEHSHLP